MLVDTDEKLLTLF